MYGFIFTVVRIVDCAGVLMVSAFVRMVLLVPSVN